MNKNTEKSVKIYKHIERYRKVKNIEKYRNM